MAFPQFIAATDAGVSQGNASVSVPAPTGAASGHYQIVVLGIVTSGANVGTTPSGWTQLANQAGDYGGETMRIAVYESTTAGSGSFDMTLTSGRVWHAIRAAYELPAGSAGRTAAAAVEMTGSTSTSQPLPSVTTAEPNSLIIGFGSSERLSGVQSWSTGSMTERHETEALNTIERIWLVLGDGQRATPGSGSPDTFTISTATRTYVGAVVLDGVADGPSYTAPGTEFDLADWKWQGPIEDPADPGDLIEVEQPELDTYASEYLHLDDDTGRMRMVAPTQGFAPSGATRSELREMEGGTEAAWDPYTEDRVRQVTATVRVDPTDLSDRQEIIIGQIHGAGGSPPVLLSAEWESSGSPVTPRIRVFKDGPGQGNMLSGEIGPTTDFTWRIRFDPNPSSPSGGRASVFAAVGGPENLPSTPQFAWDADEFADDASWYFKAGCYNKSEVANGGTGDAVVEVSFLELIQDGEPTAVTNGIGAAALSFSATAAGDVAPNTNGTASAALSLAAGATGTRTTFGTANATEGFSAGAQGVPTTFGSGSVSLGGLAASAIGAPERFGSGGTDLGGLSAAAAGERTVVGQTSAPLGGLSATAEGVPTTFGTGGTALGGLAATAIGFRDTFGSGAAFRIFTATAIGSVNGQAAGNGQASLGFSAHADGVANGPKFGIAEATLGFEALAVGEPTQQTGYGDGLADFELTATASGVRSTFGTAAATLGFYADAPVDELVEVPAPIVRPKVFAATLVARVPVSSGPPVLVEVDRLVFDGLSYTHELNRPGSATLGVPLRTLSSAVKERLADLATFPSEVWVYWGSDVVWAGEIQTIGIQDQTVQLGCAGLLGYTWRMGVTTDLTYSQVDQFTIAKSLVDHWQGQSYGNFGIDTADILTSGVERDRTYLRDELHNIGQRLQELGAVIDGFDTHVDPATRKLVLSYPQRGRDLTNSVFFDERNIDSASVALSVGPDDVVTDGSFTGTLADDAGTNTITYAARANAALRESFGRSFGAANFHNVSVDETVEGHGDAFMNARDGVFFQPGVTIVPRRGADIGDFEPGDTITYSYDAGLGRQTGPYRVAKVTVDVDASGTTRIRTEFV